MPQIELPSLEAVVTLNRCEAPPPDPVVTTVAPVRERQSLYLSAREFLYAVNAADGRARWCQQVKLIRTREVRYPPEVSGPPPHRAKFATPRVVNDLNGVDAVVYVVCEYGWGSYACAFAAGDGSLRWWTPTDARVYGGHFMDWAVPLVGDGIVYSGTYALDATDGAVRWRIPIDTRAEGALALHALVDKTLYATTDRGIYAINAQNGQIRWRYQPEAPTYLSGPPVVSGHLLYAGTGGDGGYPEQGHCFALDVKTGTLVWRYPMGRYSGAAVQHETIYVSAGDRTLYALEKNGGRLRWHHQFAGSAQNPVTVANDVLYIIGDGVYALRGADGAVHWHQPLGSSPGVSFSIRPPVVLDGAVYVVRLDKRGKGALYALDARTGAECWHTSYPSAVAVAAT